MEKDSATDRITAALAMLKTDLVEMRNQDVKLMRQLIQINETIHDITKNKSMENVSTISRSPRYLKTPLTRHRSAPIFSSPFRRDSTGSHSSFDDISSSVEDMNSTQGSEPDCDRLSISTISLPATVSSHSRSVPYMRSLPEDSDVDEKKYHGILMKNIKLWKYSTSEESLSGSDDENVTSER